MNRVLLIFILLLLIISGCASEKKSENTLTTTVHTSCWHLDYSITIYKDFLEQTNRKEMLIRVKPVDSSTKYPYAYNLTHSIPYLGVITTENTGRTNIGGNLPHWLNLDELENALRKSHITIKSTVNGREIEESIGLANTVIKKKYVDPAPIIERRKKLLGSLMPEDFNFVVKYGVGAKNAIDTYQGTFTKDLIAAGTATAKIKFTGEEMLIIHNKMDKADLFSYPENFAPSSDVLSQPHQTYYLKVQMGGKVKEIFWKDQHISQTMEAVRLRNLIGEIVDLIERKEEFKNMPEPEGAYL